MRKAIFTLAAGLLACASILASPRYEEFDRITLTNTESDTATLQAKGLIDAVYVMAPTTNGATLGSGSVTSTVTVISAPAVGSGLSSTTLFTSSTVTNATVSARPRFAPTDNAGTALTSLTVFEPFLNVGDTITLTVSQVGVAQTNVQYRVFIKLK